MRYPVLSMFVYNIQKVIVDLELICFYKSKWWDIGFCPALTYIDTISERECVVSEFFMQPSNQVYKTPYEVKRNDTRFVYAWKLDVITFV